MIPSFRTHSKVWSPQIHNHVISTNQPVLVYRKPTLQFVVATEHNHFLPYRFGTIQRRLGNFDLFTNAHAWFGELGA